MYRFQQLLEKLKCLKGIWYFNSACLKIKMIKSHKKSFTLCEIITRKSARRLLVIEEKNRVFWHLAVLCTARKAIQDKISKKEMELEIFIILVRLIFMHILSVFMYWRMLENTKPVEATL